MSTLLVGCGSDSETKTSNNSTSKSFTAEIEEAVVYDDNNIKITTKGIDDDDDDLKIKILVENNSDEDIILSTDYCSVNGYIMDCFVYIEVSAGTKANDYIGIDVDILELLGFNEIATLEFSPIFMDNDYNEIASGPDVTIETTVADTYEIPTVSGTNTLYDANNVKISYIEITDNYNAKKVYFVIENNSTKDINVTDNVFIINDYTINSSLYCFVPAGSKAIDYIYVYEDVLTENDITSIEEIQISFDIYDAQSYNTIIITDKIKFEV